MPSKRDILKRRKELLAQKPDDPNAEQERQQELKCIDGFLEYMQKPYAAAEIRKSTRTRNRMQAGTKG